MRIHSITWSPIIHLFLAKSFKAYGNDATTTITNHECPTCRLRRIRQRRNRSTDFFANSYDVARSAFLVFPLPTEIRSSRLCRPPLPSRRLQSPILGWEATVKSSEIPHTVRNSHDLDERFTDNIPTEGSFYHPNNKDTQNDESCNENLHKLRQEGFFVALRSPIFFEARPFRLFFEKRRKQQQWPKEQSPIMKRDRDQFLRAQKKQRIENAKFQTIVNDAINLQFSYDREDRWRRKRLLEKQQQQQQQEQHFSINDCVVAMNNNAKMSRDVQAFEYKPTELSSCEATANIFTSQPPFNRTEPWAINSTHVPATWNDFLACDSAVGQEANRRIYDALIVDDKYKRDDVGSTGLFDVNKNITTVSNEGNMTVVPGDSMPQSLQFQTLSLSTKTQSRPSVFLAKQSSSSVSKTDLTTMEYYLRRRASTTKNQNERRKLLAYLKAWKVKLEVDDRIDLFNEILIDSWNAECGKDKTYLENVEREA